MGYAGSRRAREARRAQVTKTAEAAAEADKKPAKKKATKKKAAAKKADTSKDD